MKQIIGSMLGIFVMVNAYALEPLKGDGDIEVKKSVDSPGKKMLNVLFKQTPQGGVYFDFYFPDEDTRSEKPVVIFIHGGGWAAGNKNKAGSGSFNVVHRALLKEGFCVMSVGYRLVDKKNGTTTMRDCVIDSMDALRFLSAYRKELGIDPNQIYTFGDSAGGHLAQMVLLAPPDSLQGDPELAKYSYKTVAGVSWYGPCDFQDPELFNGSTRFAGRIMGKDAQPEDKDARHREMSPVTYLTKESPALLMVQGDKDTTIPVKQAYRMQVALETIDAPVEILIVKNAGHNFRSVDAPIEPTREEIEEQTIEFFLTAGTGR
ncbi:alpha/beta hydrolase [Pontiellaceae bacterium B1224]|nr:alpha/beta hydrolase [Pontiellaceae bacterium B1224]